MPSNLYIQQYVSPTAPIGVVLGDEWLNPTTSKLYKQTLINGIVGWLDITPTASSTSTSSVSASVSKTISTNTANNYLVIASDVGKIISCNSATGIANTVSLSSAATLGSGFNCQIWNDYYTYNGTVIIQPYGSEKIDGKTSFSLGVSQGVEIISDGINWLLGGQRHIRGFAENNRITGARPQATGTSSLAIGAGAQSSSEGSIAIGGNVVQGSYPQATAIASIAIGARAGGAKATGESSVAIGASSSGDPYAQYVGSIAIGSNELAYGSQAVGIGAIAIGGSYASGKSSFAIAITDNTSTYGAKGDNSIAIGRLATANSSNSVAIGSGSTGVGAVTDAGSSGAIALGASYASGVDSFVAANNNNTNTYGAKNTGAIALGQWAAATNFYAVAIGSGPVAAGISSVAIGGYNSKNYATGQSAMAFGDGARATQLGKYAFTGNNFAASGDSQFGKIVLRASTTTTTAVVLTSDNAGTPSAINQLAVASGQAMAIQGTMIAKVSGSGAMAAYNITGAVSNNGGTMAVTGLALTLIGTDSIALGLAPTITVDNTNKGITITSGYKSATNIRWVATLNTSEVTYA